MATSNRKKEFFPLSIHFLDQTKPKSVFPLMRHKGVYNIYSICNFIFLRNTAHLLCCFIWIRQVTTAGSWAAKCSVEYPSDWVAGRFGWRGQQPRARSHHCKIISENGAVFAAKVVPLWLVPWHGGSV